jgi:hypothetical protein
MAKPTADWNEDDILALPAGENDFFERKGARLLDLTIPKVREDDVRDELAKQLSAFADTGGGRIIYGVNDAGTVDNGGVARVLKGRQSTKEWLENVIPTLTDFEIVGCNVYEITPKPERSVIAPEKSLYVVDVPDSDRAPHQSTRDLRYYVRLGGKSQPASHRMIEDIRNRQKHPILKIASIQIRAVNLPIEIPSEEQQIFGRLPSLDGDSQLYFDLSIENVGNMMARNTCLRLESNSIRWGDHDPSTLRRRNKHDSAPAFWEFVDPIYPGMKISFWINAAVKVHYHVTRMYPGQTPPSGESPFSGEWFVHDSKLCDAKLQWWLFADNAPAKEGAITMESLGFEKAAGNAVNSHKNRFLIRQAYPYMR